MINARSKGATGERELAALLEGWARECGVTVNLSRNLEQARNGGYDLVGISTLAIEVKRVQVLAVDTWWKQALRQAKGQGLIPFLAYRQNNKPWAFRVRVQAAHHCAGLTHYHACDADLGLTEGKQWFQYHVHVNRELFA